MVDADSLGDADMKLFGGIEKRSRRRSEGVPLVLVPRETPAKNVRRFRFVIGGDGKAMGWRR